MLGSGLALAQERHPSRLHQIVEGAFEGLAQSPGQCQTWGSDTAFEVADRFDVNTGTGGQLLLSEASGITQADEADWQAGNATGRFPMVMAGALAHQCVQ